MESYASEVKRLGEQAKSAAQLAPLTVSHNQNNPLCTKEKIFYNAITAHSLSE